MCEFNVFRGPKSGLSLNLVTMQAGWWAHYAPRALEHQNTSIANQPFHLGIDIDKFLAM